MLSNDAQSTPRPRPPAKVRRTVSGQYKDTPPPPYARAVAFPTDSDLSDVPLDTILGSPISMTAQRVRLLSGTSPNLGALPSPEVEEWMNERSREELSDLLLKADKAIRDRENELGLTSAVCKNLYQENVNLKTKHEALVARLPPSQPNSPSPSPSPISLSASSTLSHRHNRRISVTPSEITRLADQNTELMLSLEKLEAESTEADQAGKKKLRKLEKEIQLLREELERTQARSAELEEKAGKHVEEDEETLELKRKEREEKVKAVRAKTFPGEMKQEEVKDFAPGGAWSAASTPNVTPSAHRIRRDFTFPPRSPSSSSSSPTAVHFPHRAPYSPSEPEFAPSQNEETDDHDADAFSSNTSYFTRGQHQPTADSLHESALISQLLFKIRELEQTNVHILDQQAEATERMRAAQRDVEQIRRLYECLGEEGVDVQLVDPDGEDEEPVRSDQTVRFRSLRRTLEDGELDLGAFERGIREDMHSTSRGQVDTPSRSKSRHRKSVVGLFENEPTTPTSGGFSITLAGSSPPFDASASSSPNPFNAQLPYVAFPSGEDPSRSIDISADMETKHTLGSELGDDWEGPGGGLNHHLRTTSLYGLSELSLDVGDDTPDTSLNSLDVPPSWRGSAASDQANTARPEPSKRDSLRLRNRLLSQTVRARTSQWVDGRFKGTLRSQPEGDAPSLDGAALSLRPSLPRRQPSSSSTIMAPLSRTASFSRFLEDAVGTVFGPSSTPASPAPKDEDQDEAGELEVPEADKSVLKTDDEVRKGVVAVVLDLWLWLQFIIIILVFLWAMAKRGPRNVLDEAERRRAGTGNAAVQR